MIPTVLAEVLRGGHVESIHHGVIAVVDSDGALVASAGNPDHFAYFRSSAKPFQAVPLIETGAADHFDLTDRELALCCASHNAENHHQTEVLAMLRKLGLDESALRCGAPLPSDPAERARVTLEPAARNQLQCDCSGKHSGILATCLHLGEPLDDYRQPDHPAQQRILRVMAEMLRMPPDAIPLGVDGCSLPTFGASIRAFATTWATLAAPEHAPCGQGREHAPALDRIRMAMIAHPENVAGERELVTDLMAHGDGHIVAKSGAEGMICLGLPTCGWGIAIRVLDGTFRAHAVIVAEILRQLDAVPNHVIDAVMTHHDPTIRNHNGWEVGQMRAAFQLGVGR